MPISERELAARNRQLQNSYGAQSFNDLNESQKNEVIMRALQNFREGRPATKENHNRMREWLASNPQYAMQQMRTLGLAREAPEDYQGRDYQLAYSANDLEGSGPPDGLRDPRSKPVEQTAEQSTQSAQPSQSSTPTPPKRTSSSEQEASTPPDPSGADEARANAATEDGDFGEESGIGMLEQLLGLGGGAAAGYLASRMMARGGSPDDPQSRMAMPPEVSGVPEDLRDDPRIMEITGRQNAGVTAQRTMPPGTTGFDDPIEEAVFRVISGEVPQQGGAGGRAQIEAPRRQIEDQRFRTPFEDRPDLPSANLDHFIMRTLLAEEASKNNRTAGQRARTKAGSRRTPTP